MIQREGRDTVAAFIAEPMLRTSGIVQPPDGDRDAIIPVLQADDILLIVDEVVTGFGRLGTMLGCNLYGMRPDLMTVAKGLTSACAPLSGSLVSGAMYAVLCDAADRFGPIGHDWTCSADPIGRAAGIAFSRGEYADRLARTRVEMERRGLAPLLITGPSNMNWLTGYD